MRDKVQNRRLRVAGHWLMELLVVVFGVLIALYAQDWASRRQAREAARDAEARIREEIGSNLIIDAERLSLHRCLQDRLAQIAERISSGAGDWRDFAYDYTDNELFLVRRIYRAPSRNWVDDSYRGALASNALATVPPERKADLSGLYSSFTKSEALNGVENELAPELNSLWLDDGMAPSDRRRLLELVAKLDRINGLSTLIAQQNFEIANTLGFRLTGAEWNHLRTMLNDPNPDNSNQTIAMKRRIYGNCVDPTAYKLFDPARRSG